jgi:hypothetical protein
MRNFIRLLLFVILFSIGAVSLAVATLYPDLVRYYQYKQILNSSRESVEQLELLNARYDALLKNIEADPNILSRVAGTIAGVEPADANVIHPRATAEELAAAKAALEKYDDESTAEQLPEYMQRLAQPRYRISMFICGCGLVLVAFICFGPANESRRNTETIRTLKD